MRALLHDLAVSFCGAVFVLATLNVVSAQVMESSSYRLQADSINFGGGLSTSSNYNLESTAGEIATGESGSASYNLFAGYQQMLSSFISISASADIVLSPSIPGVTGGTSNGSTTVTVITDNSAGYQLAIQASNDPAMQKGSDTIADYAPASADPDFTFTIAATSSHFGYTPEGAHIVQRFQDDGGSCNAGSADASLSCWDGLTTSPVIIASDTSPNQPSGATTSVRFRVGIGGSVVQPPGFYIATTTLTATTL